MEASDLIEEFAVCPYNPQHRMPRLRLQYHLVKCQVNYPNYAICPYNATHRVLMEHIQNHARNCPSKQKIFPEDRVPYIVAKLMKPRPLEQSNLTELDPNHEMWDN